MYGQGGGSFTTTVGSAAVVGSGVAVLPSTAGETFGTVLAYAAITIGALALTSQVAVRLMRRYGKKA